MVYVLLASQIVAGLSLGKQKKQKKVFTQEIKKKSLFIYINIHTFGQVWYNYVNMSIYVYVPVDY